MIESQWIPVKHDKLSLYRQIYLHLKSRILNGELSVHTKLPSQRDLAAKFRVNRSTIRIAIDELIAEGLVTSKVGSGVWVSNNTWSKFSHTPLIDWQEYLNENSHLSNLPLIQEINSLEFKKDIIRLGTGELSQSLLPTKTLCELIKCTAAKIDNFGYEEPKGLFYLRQQISIHLKTLGIQASPNSILIVSGALQALQLILFGLLPQNSQLFLEQPSYLSSLKMLKTIKAKFSEIPLDEEGIDIDALRYQHKANPHTLLYTIPTFHNPTGILMSQQRRKKLLATCKQIQLPIVEDDVYHELWLHEPPPLPLKAMDKTGNVIYIDSLSKSVGAGLRIGWIVGPEPVVNKLADIKMQNDYGSSCLSQWVAAEWFASRSHEMHLQKLRITLANRQKIVLNLLTKYFSQIASWTIPKGGFYIWLKINKPISMYKIFKFALSYHILINPGNLYDNLSNTNLRISYAYANIDDLTYSLQKLSDLIKIELKK